MDIFEKKTKKQISKVEMLGCGGGSSGGLYSILDAELMMGAEYFIKIAQIEKLIKKCDYVLTGEGIVDHTTFEGKLPYILLQLAKKYEKPVILATGALEYNYFRTLKEGFYCILNIDFKFHSIEEIRTQNLMPKILVDFGKNLGYILKLPK